MHDLRSNRFKVAIADAQPRRIVLISVWRRRSLAFDVNRLSPVVAFHRAIERETDAAHAGDRCEIVVELAVEGIELGRFVSRHLRIDVQDVAVCGLEPELLMLHISQALRQQSRSAQQHQRQRRLCDDQRLLGPAHALPGGTVGSAQRVGGICRGRHPRWSDAEQDSSQQSHDKGKGKHRQRRRGVNGHIILLKREMQDEPGPGKGKSDSGDSAKQSQHRALGQHQSDLPRSRRTQRCSDRGLLLARGRAH